MNDDIKRGVNSKDYWERRFEEDWESNNGREQSTFFSQLVIDNLPAWFVNEVNGCGLSVCDWGCAEGDGTALLANFLPGAKLTGVDFSEMGIQTASRCYPHIDFFCSDWLDPTSMHDKEYDVVFSSNTLEHFGDPWDVAQRISKYCSKMFVFLLPFQEKDRIDEHFYTFEFHNIKLVVFDDFRLAYSRVIESGEYVPTYWKGRQILLVFIRVAEPVWNSLTLDNSVIATSLEDGRLLGALNRVSELRAQKNAEREELEAQLRAQRQELEAQRSELEEQGRELQRVRATVDEILSSKSWRVTAPMRWIVDRLGRARMALRSRKTPVVISEPDTASWTERPLPLKRSPPTRLSQFRVAAIMDTFTESCFAPECELVQFRPDNWQVILSERPPDLLFVESAWKGNDGAWQYRVAEYPSPPGRELLELLAWCKKVGIPTVFWNKEDPPHFDDFINTACRFDWIFTTDANCIPRYRERCGHERVFALPFAAQPEIHNPILAGPRNHKVCFAGTYYEDRFDARRSAIEILLKPALEFDLDIFDRMHGAVGPGTENYQFPGEYRAHIVGRLEYKDMVDAYRRYRVFLNVNSVSDSKTMFARRVFELLACGTPVVSTESLGIREMFPGIVPIVNDSEQARAAIAELLTDDRSWRRCSALGVRRVMQVHTYSRRLRQVCETVGFSLDPESRPSVTLAVLPGPNPEATASQLESQTRRPDRIVLVRNAHAQALVKVLERSGIPAPVQVVEVLSDAIGRKPGVVVAFIDGTQTYGPGYLEDALLALDYSGALSTSMTEHLRLAKDGSVECVTDLGDANVLSKHVKRACFVCRGDVLSPGLVDSIFSSGALELDVASYARSPFEFVEGGALEPDDQRMMEIALEETAGVGQT